MQRSSSRPASRPVQSKLVRRSRAQRRSARTAAVVIAVVMATPLNSPASAKTPGATYCFLGVCHRVKTIPETRALVGKTLTKQTSFYDDPSRDRFNPSNLTSSGEYFRSGRPDNAASPVLPDGTKLLVWHPRTKRAVIVRVNNAGPYHGRRQLDLSRAAAERLGFAHAGVATVSVRVLEAPTPAEATYRRGRSYAPVPGFLGIFDTIDTALADAGRVLGRLFLGPEPIAGVTLASREETTADAPQRLAKAGRAAKGSRIARSTPARTPDALRAATPVAMAALSASAVTAGATSTTGPDAQQRPAEALLAAASNEARATFSVSMMALAGLPGAGSGAGAPGAAVGNGATPDTIAVEVTLPPAAPVPPVVAKAERPGRPEPPRRPAQIASAIAAIPAPQVRRAIAPVAPPVTAPAPRPAARPLPAKRVAVAAVPLEASGASPVAARAPVGDDRAWAARALSVR